MTITQEEADKTKKHLLGQLENFPEDKREQIKEQIDSMTTEEIENFVQQNQLTHLGGQCIFCSIVSGKNPAVKIGENKENIAVLELNPLSKGHSLIIPFTHSDKLPNSSISLKKQIFDKLNEKFNPKDIQTDEVNIMGHQLLEIIPLYGNEIGRKKSTETALRKIQEELLKPSKELKIKTEAIEELPKFLPRIP